MITIAKLNKKETKFLNDLWADLGAEYLEEEITKARLLKTFLRELKKVEKRNGYEPTKADITNAIGYFGASHYDSIEEFIFCFKDDLRAGAERYFETYY